MSFTTFRHTGYKRFSCQVCMKLYAGSYDLRRHLLQHHPDHSRNIKPRLPLTPQIVQLVDERMRPGGKKREEDRDLQCGDLEIDLGALNAAEVPIEELEVDASVVFLTEDGRAIQELKQV